jgi:hypothetical protein
MTRGRIKTDCEHARELVEADLAALGNARVYLRLVTERLQVISQRGQGSLVDPAVDDLHRADTLIKQVQVRIARAAGE